MQDELFVGHRIDATLVTRDFDLVYDPARIETLQFLALLVLMSGELVLSVLIF